MLMNSHALLLPLLLSLPLLQDAQTPSPAPAPIPAPTTDAAAQAAWDALAQATLDEKPVTAFDLAFHMRLRPDDIQSNDLAARYRFLAPDFIRATLESGREHLRGPTGDYLIDGKEILKLVGREATQDRQQLDETIGIARNFLALTDPSRLKPTSVQPAATPEHLLPLDLIEHAKTLRWIAITTKGFHLLASPTPLPEGAHRSQHALLGLDPTTPTLRLALIIEDTLSAENTPIARPTHVLLDLRRTAALDNFQVPRHLRVHTPNPEGQRFRTKPSFELWLRGGTLRPGFTAAEFNPRM